MPYTAEQEMEFKRQFAVRRRRQMLLVIPFVLFFIGVTAARNGHVLGVFGLPPEVLSGAFLVFAIVAVLFSLKNWRCPACERYLGRSMSPRFCPKCGVGLSGDAAPRS
jgi:hypothetical protein